MATRSWIRKLFTRPIRKQPHSTHLGVERLEDRMAPATFTVSNTLDNSSIGSLRWAVGQANATAGADTINFNSSFSTPKTITLTSGELKLTDAATTTITGPAANLLSISGNKMSRVLTINAGASAALSGVTITGGGGSLQRRRSGQLRHGLLDGVYHQWQLRQ